MELAEKYDSIFKEYESANKIFVELVQKVL